jgi:hypothetical protein
VSKLKDRRSSTNSIFSALRSCLQRVLSRAECKGHQRSTQDPPQNSQHHQRLDQSIDPIHIVLPLRRLSRKHLRCLPSQRYLETRASQCSLRTWKLHRSSQVVQVEWTERCLLLCTILLQSTCSIAFHRCIW